MRNILLITSILSISLLLVACNADQPQQSEIIPENTTADQVAVGEPLPDEIDYWAKDNLDLSRVGNLLERSDDPQRFESYLNDDDGINNLDLNGDGYVDYLSVDEFEDRGPNERGLSIYSRFGPDLIQEIATVILYRDDLNSPGARILLTGNDQIYGDNHYYETNWVDRTIGLASLLFRDRDSYYRSPYYYDNYPPDYNVYEVVEPSLYRSRVERIYPEPVFVLTTNPSLLTKVKIKSPNNGLHLGQIKAKLVKPTKEQAEFLKNNPGRVKVAKADKIGKDDKGGNDRGKSDDAPGRDKPAKEDRKADDDNKGNPSKPAKAEKDNAGPAKADNPGKGKGKKP